MDFFSINTSKINKCNGSDFTAYNYMCRNKILAATFLIVHLVVYQLLGLLIQTIMINNGITSIMILRIYSTFISLSIICLFYLIVTAVIPDLRNSIFKKRFIKYSYILLFTVALIVANYVGNFIINIVTSPFTTSSNQNQQDLIQMFKVSPAIMFFTTVVLAPIAEEYAYRLGLVSLFGNKRKILSIIFSGVLFGLIHFDFTSIWTSSFLNEFMNLFSYIFAGLLFGYAYIRSESPVPSIGAHLINNLLASLLIIVGVAN